MISLETDLPVFTANDVTEQMHRLVSAIKEQPEVMCFFGSFQALQADEETQKLLSELRARQYVVGDEAAYQQLLQQFYSRSSVKAYQATEEALYDLLRAVDVSISEAADIDFAANAKRSCCGG
jgi:cell fate (sporulation/competence/biofilm development) regulator YlbF (YheA/YmcA/DUF963 family)